MRRLLILAAVAVGLIAIGLGSAAGIGALAERFNLRIAASNGKAAGNLPVLISTGGGPTMELGTTNAAGELAVALDSAKNGKSYNVYRQSCSRIVLIEQGTPEDRHCDEESRKASPSGQCRECDKLGAFIFGKDATIGKFNSGMGTGTKVALAGGIGGAAAAIGIAAANGGTNPPAAPSTPAAPTLINVPGTLTASATSRGCNLIAPNYTAAATISTNAALLVTLTISDPGGVTLVLTGQGVLNSVSNTISVQSFSAFRWTSASGRNYETSGASASFSSNGTGTLQVTHTYLGGGPAGPPPPNCQDTYNASFATR